MATASRQEMFDAFMARTGEMLGRLEPGMFEPPVDSLLPALRNIHSQAFLPAIEAGVAVLSVQQVASDGAMVVPLLGPREQITASATAYGSTYARIQILADILDIYPHTAMQLTGKLLHSAVKKGVAYTSPSPRYIDAQQVQHTFNRHGDSGVDTTFELIGRSAIVIGPAFWDLSPAEQGAFGVQEYLRIQQTQSRRQAWPHDRRERLRAFMSAELRGVHVAAKALQAAGVTRAEASSEAVLAYDIEKARLEHPHPQDPFTASDQIMPTLLAYGIVPSAGDASAPPPHGKRNFTPSAEYL